MEEGRQARREEERKEETDWINNLLWLEQCM